MVNSAWTIRAAARRSRALFLFTTLLIAALALAACGRGGESSLREAEATPIDAFPTSIGRGFGEVKVAGLDNRGTGLAAGDAAPNFALQLADGRHLTLRDLQGRPVMINFWATWCGPCRMEMPDIVAAADADQDLVVLAINVQEGLDAIEPFAAEFAMTMPVGRDTDGALRDLYQVRGMPTSVFINPDGTVAANWSGLLTAETLNAFLQAIDAES